eukprot:TRINITY_DN11015_c0_g6_i1.p1 TRINITY_DN11015_c0_g6~~TRINITY_DN11015_c0_g6_i1.p1  ORF type:complete len:294 (-),score=1.60 TRINITY_DN11015_c0_g6_i1:181-1005(-)
MVDNVRTIDDARREERARVHTFENSGHSVWDQYMNFPPITRFFATAWFVNAFLTFYGWLPWEQMTFSPRMIFQQFQTWRLVTPMLFLGSFGLPFVMAMIWFLTYAPLLERSVFQFNPADYLVFYIFNAIAYSIISIVVPPLGFKFFGFPTVFAVIYLYSRHFPNKIISFYGLFTIRAFYLPFALTVIEMCYGKSLKAPFVGIGVGHLYYFLTVLYPRQSGNRSAINAPQFLVRWLSYIGIGHASMMQEQYRQNVARGGNQAFSGRAFRVRNLND